VSIKNGVSSGYFLLVYVWNTQVLKGSSSEFTTNVADSHHFDANLDPDPACHSDADPDQTFHFDPDHTFHFDPDPDPSFQRKAHNLEKGLKYCGLIFHLLSENLNPAHHFDADADPDPAYHVNTDPDPTFQFGADLCGY
jgi:hypothetical protein